MTLFQGPDGDPRAGAATLGDLLCFYGDAGDRAMGNPAGFGRRKAAAAVCLASVAHPDGAPAAALAFAGLLHAIGALGNAGLRKDEALPERLALMARWDIPVEGARACAAIAALPDETPDLVRWQAESWDGNGNPDQLRWQGIPPGAQLLRLADLFAAAEDPDAALMRVAAASGRDISPEMARTFMQWFHLTGGEVDPLELPVDALAGEKTSPDDVLDGIADRIDIHCGIPGRWRRVAAIVDAVAARLALDPAERRALALAARLFGSGEIDAAGLENALFDPLARLGIDERARNASSAASLLAGNVALESAMPIVSARAEWFDGTGKPSERRGNDIPIGARVLGVAIAYDSLDQLHRSQIRENRISPSERIDTAAGTQFDPRTVAALIEFAKAHA
jgi:response regulator RpfG family c-di-GMP phosphodiesterase